MSWECDSQTECPCPCGEGRIYQNHYSDDWNRFESDTPVIECDKCEGQYRIETFSFYTCDGEYCSTYYCVKNSYPQYTGKIPEGKYTGGFSIYDVDFTQYLVELYSKNTLEGVFEILNSCGTYRNINDSGTGATTRGIIRSYKSFFKTQRIAIIRTEVEKAINKYYEYESRFDVLEKARSEYEAYIREKKSKSILLNL